MIEYKNIKSIKNTNNTKNINHINNMNNIITVVVLGVVFVSLTMASWLLPPQEFSDNERRKLAQRPKFSLDTMSDGSFMTEFEKYTLDQFPLRDQFRTLKAYTIYDVFGQLDNHDIYIQDGYAAKLEYPLQMDSLEHAADRFAYIYEKYLADKEMNIYLSIVPDKSYFLAEKHGYLSMDYEKLFHVMQNHMNYADYIDITGTLDITDYYKTDTIGVRRSFQRRQLFLRRAWGRLSPELTQNMRWMSLFMVYIMVCLLFHCRQKRYIIYPMMF